MTLDDIEGMTDAEWFALPSEQKYEASQVLLQSLVDEGMVYLGIDGRYRMRENLIDLGGGRFSVPKVN